MSVSEIHCSYHAGQLTLSAAVTLLIEQHGWPVEKAFGFFR